MNDSLKLKDSMNLTILLNIFGGKKALREIIIQKEMEYKMIGIIKRSNDRFAH